MVGILPRPTPTGQPADEPRQEPTIRLRPRSLVAELLLGSAVAAALSLVLQFLVVHLGISEPSFAPEALAVFGSTAVLVALFGVLAFGRRYWRRSWRVVSAWVSLTAFTTLALAIPLQGSRFYYGGSSVDNGFRMQYMTRMASTLGLADMNYPEIAPYYPAGWFWLGGRFANLIGWQGWAAYKPYALTWIAVTAVVTFTLWSILLRRRTALLAALVTTLSGGMMLHGIMEPYAWPSAAWLPPVAVLTWYTLHREAPAPRGALVGIGCFVGFAAVTYTLHFGFAVLLTVTMAVVIGVLRVREGHRVGATARRLFLRLLPIGVVSGLIALLVWTPFLFAGGFLHSSAAQHYLPESGALLPLPMTEANPFGALCLAGLIWLLLRCRGDRIATAMLTIVAGIYCWFGLSTLALMAETTLLAFRLKVILGSVLAVAGVLGLLELIAHLRQRLTAHHAARTTVVACALGLIGAVSLTQTTLGDTMASDAEKAYTDYYPTGANAKGQRDPEQPDAWLDELIGTISTLSGSEPADNIVLSTNYTLMSFRPYLGFQQETPHYANPLADYEQRAVTIHRWANADDSRELLRMLKHSRFTPPNVFVLRNTPKSTEDSEGTTRPARNSDELTLNLKADTFPQQPNVHDYTVSFDPKVFDSPAFVQREVGPYTVIVRR